MSQNDKGRWKKESRLHWLISCVIILGMWQFIASSKMVDKTLLPSPLLVLKCGSAMVRSGEILVHIFDSLKRILMGFGIGIITATIFGMLIGRFKIIRSFFEPVIEYIRPIPALAFLPLAILWFGIGEQSKVFLIWFGTFFVAIVSITEGISNIDVVLVRIAKNLQANGLQMFIYVLLPAILPFFLEALRQGIGVSFRVLVAAEMIAAETGIGFLILQSSLYYRSDRVFVGIITLGLIGMCADRLIRFLTIRYFLRYKKEQAQELAI